MTRTSKPQSVGAPIKGWNTRDPKEAMEPTDAITLDNWFPDVAGVAVRNGFKSFATTGAAAPVQTLATFTGGAVTKLLAAAGGIISDVSTGTPSQIGVGFQSDIFSTVQFNKHLFLFNGLDQARIYDGLTLSVANFTGVTTNNLVAAGVFNNRLYCWTGLDAGFYYGPVNGIAGAFAFFDFSTVTLTGGNLVSVEVLSYDGGTGIDDYTCFFLSSGEVLMYSGTDPSNPSNWSLVGRYAIAPPVAQRAIVRYGGDIYLATADDHQQFSKFLIALRLGETPPRSKITGAANAAYLNGKSLPGWQALYYPTGRKLIFNIPNPGGTFSQHVYNTTTQAWSRFVGMNAHCWAVFADDLYFGGANGTVYHADTGTTDNGSPISAIGQQSWQTFESPLKKRVTAVRPVVQTSGKSSFTFSIGTDYEPANISMPVGSLDLGMVWGQSNWGAPTLWGGAEVSDPRWHIAAGEGGAIGFALVANSEIGAIWIRTDFLLEPGVNL